MIFQKRKEKLLLASCDAAFPEEFIRQLKNVFDLGYYFYAPDIHSEEEYEKRKKMVEDQASSHRLPFEAGAYECNRWSEMTESLKDEPPGGHRCDICFRMKINEICRFADENDFSVFAISFNNCQYHNKEMILKICQKFARDYGLRFFDKVFVKEKKLDIDFKAMMAEKTTEVDYCGCIFSFEENQKEEK